MRTRWVVRECECGELASARRIRCEFCGRNLFGTIEVVRAVGARTSDPDTSKLAALRNEPRRGSQRARMLDAIRESGRGGLTARQASLLADVEGGWKRVSELKQGGHIVCIGERNDLGNQAEVFVAAEHRPSYMDVDE